MGLLGAIAGGVGVLGFLQDQSNKKASNKAVQAQIDAANKNRALFESIYNQSRDDQAPGRAVYGASVNAAAQRLGLAPINAGGLPGPASFTGGGNSRAYSAMPGSSPAQAAQMTVAPGGQAGAPSGQAQPMGGSLFRSPNGAGPPAGNDGPPGPAPAGKQWVHGPEGYILQDIRPQTSFRDAIGGLGGKQRKSDGGFAGTSPIEPAPQPGGQVDMSTIRAESLAPTSAQAAAPAGQPDFASYGAANPDLQAEWQRIQQTGNADGFGNDPNAYYAWHWNQYGQNEANRAPPPGMPGSQPQAPTPTDPNAPPAEYYQESYEQRPDALAVPEFQRGADVQFQDYGQGPQFSWDPSQIANDKGFQF